MGVIRAIKELLHQEPPGSGIPLHCTQLYGKPGISVSLEMRVDSKRRNVGFLALSGRCTVTSLTTAPSHNRKFGTADHYIDFHITLG